MESIHKTIGLLCITGYITGILSEFVPSGYTRKAIRLTIAVYIIASVFIPLGTTFDWLDFQFSDTEDYSGYAENYVIEKAGNQLESTISQTLSDKNISYNQIDVHIHKQSEGLQIENIYIYGVDVNQKAAVQNILSSYGNIIFGD